MTTPYTEKETYTICPRIQNDFATLPSPIKLVPHKTVPPITHTSCGPVLIWSLDNIYFV